MRPETLTWSEGKRPKLVTLAEAYVKKTELFKATDDSKGKPPGKQDPLVKTSQLRNLLNAAQAGHPFDLLRNFLRYQIARGGKGWPHAPSGEELLTYFKYQLQPLCAEYSGLEEKEKFELEAHVAAQFLGFVIREYTYRCSCVGTRA